MDALISNLEHYHAGVRQSMKQFVEQNNVPDNVEETTFVGQYSH
jgi:hypothetical protein